jgi:putative ABC transport system ATP-binding protein
VLGLKDISFQYPVGDFRLAVPSLELAAGETLAVIGPSGSGKTTLLNLIAGILLPDAGEISLAGVDVTTLSDGARRNLRLRRLGLVFQEFELLEYLRVSDNVLLPFRIGQALTLTDKVRATVAELAGRVGIGAKLDSFPGQLSQGERQRVALCRALINGPELILADEPTGNLDPANKGLAMDFLFDYVRERNAGLITVTHDYQMVERFDRVIDFGEFLSGQRGGGV